MHSDDAFCCWLVAAAMFECDHQFDRGSNPSVCSLLRLWLFSKTVTSFQNKKKSNSLLQSYVGFYIVSLGGPTRICCASCSLFWASPRVHYRKEKARLGRLSRPKKQNKKNLLRLGSWSPSRSTKLSYVTLKKKKIILRVCSSHVAALIQKRKLKAAAAC